MKKYQKLLAGVLAASMMAACRMRFRRRKHPRFFRFPCSIHRWRIHQRSGQHHRSDGGDPVYGGNLTCY